MTSKPLLRRRPASSKVFRQVYDDRLKEKYEELCELIQKTPGLPCVENDLYEKAKRAMKMYERSQKGYLPDPLPLSKADRIGRKPYCWHAEHADFGVQVEERCNNYLGVPEHQYVTTTARQRFYYDDEYHDGTLGNPNKLPSAIKKKRRPFSAVVTRKTASTKLNKSDISSSLTSLSSIGDEKDKANKELFHRWDPKDDNFMKDWLREKKKIEKQKKKLKKKEMKEKEDKEREKEEIEKMKQEKGEKAFKEWSQRKQKEIINKKTQIIKEQEEEEQRQKEEKERMEKLFEEWKEKKEKEKKLLSKRNNVNNKNEDVGLLSDFRKNKEFLEWVRKKNKESQKAQNRERVLKSEDSLIKKTNEKRKKTSKKANLKSVSKKDVEKLSEKCHNLKKKDDEILNSNTTGKEEKDDNGGYLVKCTEKYEDELIKQNENLITQLEQKDNLEIITRLETQIELDKKNAAFNEESLSTGRKSKKALQIELVEHWNSSMTIDNDESPSVSISFNSKDEDDEDEKKNINLSENTQNTEEPTMEEGAFPVDQPTEEDKEGVLDSSEKTEQITTSKDSGAILNEAEDHSLNTESQNAPQSLDVNYGNIDNVSNNNNDNSDSESNSIENNRVTKDEDDKSQHSSDTEISQEKHNKTIEPESKDENPNESVTQDEVDTKIESKTEEQAEEKEKEG